MQLGGLLWKEVLVGNENLSVPSCDVPSLVS